MDLVKLIKNQDENEHGNTSETSISQVRNGKQGKLKRIFFCSFLY